MGLLYLYLLYIVADTTLSQNIFPTLCQTTYSRTLLHLVLSLRKLLHTNRGPLYLPTLYRHNISFTLKQSLIQFPSSKHILELLLFPAVCMFLPVCVILKPQNFSLIYCFCHTYFRPRLLTYLLHGAESFLRS